MGRPATPMYPATLPPPETAEDVCSAGAVDVNGAEEFTGVSGRELYRAMDRGEIEWFYHGRIRLIARKTLTKWLAAKLAAERRERAKRV